MKRKFLSDLEESEEKLEDFEDDNGVEKLFVPANQSSYAVPDPVDRTNFRWMQMILMMIFNLRMKR